MGLDKVVKDISDKADAESKAIIARAASEAAEIKKAAEGEAKDLYASQLEKADLSISKMRQRELSSAKLDIKKSKLNAEKDVLDEVHKNFKKELQALPKEKKADMLKKLVALAKKDVPAGKIFTSAGDADLVKDSGYEYGGNVNVIGGIIVTSADGSINLDYTFDSMLEDVWTSSMKPVSDILFGIR
ncbi:V-type ATP synthase subunit E [Methanocella sp. CWC-04]|uniref:A-type ATP synthase subunit E n=1 Tax=Methanooceanicella nereidis TaxID=2052831 RepID=A0AAP2W8F5_9EURY|nr:V-type ATP synthase subunit E family protein [Methanocella sp. CWC-04]MCD1295991.1 V-type ATP synthase subunit E [Methanocella sp. CWC-04]